MRLKAFFLLLIFLLNTVVGFACALKIEHRNQENKTIGHDHDHSSHAHDVGATADIAHNHGAHKHSAHSETAHKKSGLNHSQSGSAEDNSCCQDEVSKFYSLDKIAPQHGKIFAKAPVFESALFYYISFDALLVKKEYTKYIDNRQRPPTSDIRTVIQSFQI